MNPPLPVDLTRRPSPETALLQLALLAGALLLGGPLFVAGAVWSFQRLRLDPSARAVLLVAVLALCGALLWAAFWPALRAAYGALFGGGTRRLPDLVTIWGLSACLIPIG
ncbi:MAG: hypothetical protein H0X71_08070, partial [Rubrobacter sp.]|nr:hypothetical protein [Rubrobacter sp.]